MAQKMQPWLANAGHSIFVVCVKVSREFARCSNGQNIARWREQEPSNGQEQEQEQEQGQEQEQEHCVVLKETDFRRKY